MCFELLKSSSVRDGRPIVLQTAQPDGMYSESRAIRADIKLPASVSNIK